MALSGILWSLWLLLLTIKPNETVNWIMMTENFDNGTFWLMVDPSTSMVGLAVCGLVAVIIAYASVLLKIIRKQNRKEGPRWSFNRRVDAVTTIWRRELFNSRHGSKVTSFLGQSVTLIMKSDSHAVKIVVSRCYLAF
ncbi:hypothetical protein PHMEG_00040454 [Phytophthora megakarya]|uniref:Uncharacterized protein n=1 Tax=Phytophthora megakarya TaxID=4795 RepID=A0A225UD03_9STRA|nr:hypothetical protein PHMEG_00040454 [Phytophthora megakarya]